MLSSKLLSDNNDAILKHEPTGVGSVLNRKAVLDRHESVTVREQFASGLAMIEIAGVSRKLRK